MNDAKGAPAISTYREWVGNRRYLESAYRKYDFPVSVRKVDVRRGGEGAGHQHG